MPTVVSARSPWLRQVPPVVATEVRRRRSEILASASGRILDLDDPAAEGFLEAPIGEITGLGEMTYDRIVSTCRLMTAPDLFLSLSALVARLAPDGELVLVEPVGRPGVGGLLTASLGTWLPGQRDLHLARDLPAAVRATGLTVVDADRFTVPTAVWPLRHLVELRAIRLRGDGTAEPGR